MKEIKCLVCNKVIKGEKEQYVLRDFYKHLRVSHRMKRGDYFILYELDGKTPLCHCGCSTPVTTKKGWNIWHKYYGDHKNRMPPSQETIDKLKMSAAQRKSDLLYYKDVDKNLLKASFDDFKNSRMNLSSLSEKYDYDKRTLRDMWIAFGFCTTQEYKRIGAKNNSILGTKAKREKIEKEKSFYREVYDFIHSNPYLFTMREVNRKFGFKYTDTTMLKNLMFLFGEENVVPFLKCGYASKEEDFFFKILRFYLGGANVKQGFRLENKLYDGLIYGKILIEYDGEGFFHSSKEEQENDRTKDQIAEDRGYVLIRFSLKMMKDISFIKELEKWKSLS
ncbi:MAG: hypothetical protein M0P12_00565 [Paludibacteraceae bacterium]|nr:hypothetical protein [Paludibacteraceae bacterium]MCK9615807.1 hypothetical protein [Candidatus Omnitrophota bacterium]